MTPLCPKTSAARAYYEKVLARNKRVNEELPSFQRHTSRGSNSNPLPPLPTPAPTQGSTASPSTRTLFEIQHRPPLGNFTTSDSQPSGSQWVSTQPASAQPAKSPPAQHEVVIILSSPPPPDQDEINPPTSSSCTHPGDSPPPYSQTLLKAFGAPKLGSEEYVVGLPLNIKSTPGALSQKDVHLNAIIEKQQEISQFLDEQGDDPDLKNKMLALVREVSLIVTHPALALSASDTASDKRVAEHHVIMSSKFQFLKTLMDQVRNMSIKIGIAAEAPTVINMLEVFFRGIKVDYKRLDRASTLPVTPDSAVLSTARVLLIPSKARSGVLTNNCHVVIAFDSTFDADSPEIQQVRLDAFDPAKTAPVLRLITINTVEHLLLCLNNQPNSLRPIVEAITVLQKDAGIMAIPYEAASQKVAQILGSWLLGKCEGKLDFPAFPELELSKKPVASSSAQETSQENSDKRKREPDSGFGKPGPKKQKVSGEPSTINDVGDTTHAAETQPDSKKHKVSGEPSTINDVGNITHVTEDVKDTAMDVDVDSEATESDDEAAIPRARPVDKEVEPKLEDLTKEEIISRLRETTSELEKWKSDASVRQYGFENLRQENGLLRLQVTTMENEKRQAIDAMTRASKESAKNISTARDLRAKLRDRVDCITTPTQEKMAQLWNKMADLEAEKTSLTAKLESVEKDYKYSREQYQQASTACLSRAGEIEDLTAQVEKLSRAADERVIALRKATYDNSAAAKDAEMEKLQIMLRERETRLRRLEQDRNRNTRGPVATRSNSVPQRPSPAQSRANTPPVSIMSPKTRLRELP